MLCFPGAAGTDDGWVRDFVLIGDGWNKDGNLKPRSRRPCCRFPRTSGRATTGPVCLKTTRSIASIPTIGASIIHGMSARTSSITVPGCARKARRNRPSAEEHREAICPRRSHRSCFSACSSFCGRSTTCATTGSNSRSEAHPSETSPASPTGAEASAGPAWLVFERGIQGCPRRLRTFRAATCRSQAFAHHAAIASMGAWVAVADFDRDGWNDFYVTNSGEDSANGLYRNQADGTFRDVAESLGVAQVNSSGTGVSMGSLWGDYDNDGYEDLFVYKWGRPELFHNDAGKNFTRVTEKAGLPRWLNAGWRYWLDFDRDGSSTSSSAATGPEDVDFWHLKNTKMMPESFEYAQNGGRKYLFRNLGDGKFEEVTAARWVSSASAGPWLPWRPTCAAPAIPISSSPTITACPSCLQPRGQRRSRNRQGDRNRSSAQERHERRLWRIFNQGRFSVYVTNISEEGFLCRVTTSGCRKTRTSGRQRRVRQPRRSPGCRAGWLELRRTVR